MDNNGVPNNEISMNEEPVLIPMTEENTTPSVVPGPIDNPAPQVTNAVPETIPVADNSISPIEETTNPVEVTTQPQEEVKKKKGLFHKKEKKKKEKETIVEEKTSAEVPTDIKPVKARRRLPLFWILLVAALCGYIYYSNLIYRRNIDELIYQCSPVTASKQEVSLDINSTLVQSLYKKVYTNIREDYAQPEWDNTMKLYLAYRQIPDSLKYESNCNLFNNAVMRPYECEVKDFTPLAFKKEDLILKWKELFGEETEYVLDNIKLKNSCIGGYQYIPEREEFVQGYCNTQTAISFKVEKELVDAISTRNTITLVEEVKYHGNEKMDLPDYLVSGTYYYLFRLDMNYHYVLVSKTYHDKY